MSLRLRIAERLSPLSAAAKRHRLRRFVQQNFGKQFQMNADSGDLVMNRKVSESRKLSKHGKNPTTYRRIVTGNVNGKSVVQSDEALLA